MNELITNNYQVRLMAVLLMIFFSLLLRLTLVFVGQMWIKTFSQTMTIFILPVITYLSYLEAEKPLLKILFLFHTFVPCIIGVFILFIANFFCYGYQITEKYSAEYGALLKLKETLELLSVKGNSVK